MSAKTLNASPQTCHWGFFDATLPPPLTVQSGDEVVVRSVSGTPANLPPKGYHVPPELLEIHAAGAPAVPGHILTGSIAVEGAQPGDVLQVDILEVALRQDWGYNYIGPLKGTLPQDFPDLHHTIIPLDAARGVALMPWGLELPLAPFFGVMGVAPPPAWGRISTIEPRVHGGNIDNKELVAAQHCICPSTLRVRYSPVVTATAHRAMAKSV